MCSINIVTRKYQTKVSILTCLSVIVAVGVGFDFKCPEQSHWKFRKKMCGTPEKYSCLYDIQKREYVESCSDKKDFVKPGKRYVRMGGRDSADCNDSRYQPRKFWSDQTSDCEMLKSTCNEEGQVAVSDGSTTEDRACRCDFLNGFSSVTTETNISSCIQSLEDCCCYRTIHKREFHYGKFTKLSWKYLSFRETVIKLLQSKYSVGMSMTVYTSEKESIWKKVKRHFNDIDGIILHHLLLLSCLLTIIAIIALALFWRQIFGSKENTFESEQKMLEDLITENWLHLQENGNPFTWEDEFLKAKLLTKYENEPNTSKPRALLVELILTECLQNAKKTEDIKLISSVIFSSTVSATKHGGGEKNAPSRESVESIKRYTDILSKNREKIGEYLKLEDVIFIRGHLIQNRIINFTENEKLIKQEEPCSSLEILLIDLITNKLEAGSYQCFIQSLETINKTKSQERLLELLKLLKNDSEPDDFLPDTSPTCTVIVEEIESTVFENNIDGKDNFTLRITAENQEGHEVDDVYQQMQSKPDDLNRIVSSNLGGSVESTGPGSLIINLQMMERNMQDYLKECIRRGRVTQLIQMLFSEISLENIIPDGKLHIKVNIEVNDIPSLPEPQSNNSPDITRFVIDNHYFLLEEMDTDAIEIAFKDFGVKIPIDEHRKGRREKANHILSFVVEKDLQRMFMLLIQVNRGSKFSYLRSRLSAYTKAYTTDLKFMRKNILLQFSEIVCNITISDIQEVLLDRKAVTFLMLHTIKYKHFSNREINMATLLLTILKSGDAVRAFVDALFIMNSFLADQMIRCESEISIIETGPTVEIRETSADNRLLIEGHFTIDIIQRGFLTTSKRNDHTSVSIEQKLDLIKQKQSLIHKMIKFEKTLLEWFEEAKSVIETLEGLAEEMDGHFTRISKAKIGGSAAGIVGSVIGIVGIALTPFTFGASLGLTIAGGVVATAGGATVGGSLIADNVLSKQTMTKAKEKLSVYSRSSITIKETCLLLSRQMAKVDQSEDPFPHWVSFWTQFVRGQETNTNNFSWQQTQELLINSLDNFNSTVRFVSGDGFGPGVKIAGSTYKITGSTLQVASGVVSALLIPLDIVTLVYSAIDVHKKNKNETSKLIIQISQTLAAELPTRESIKNMIMLTINSI